MWDLFERLLGRSARSGDATEEVLADLEGRHLHYLSARKIRTLAAEMGIAEDVGGRLG
jgi:hypothetical protein